MKPSSPNTQSIPLKMVGGSSFGQYAKISAEKTYNMLISDNFLIPFPGYKNVGLASQGEVGRGIFVSANLNKLVLVVGSGVFLVDTDINIVQIANLLTANGDVFITENEGNQIAICDKQNIYIYNYAANTFNMTPFPTGYQPGYIEFQDGYFIAPGIQQSPATLAARWYLSAPNSDVFVRGGDNPLPNANTTGTFQTKPDEPLACVRFPGRGNLLLIFGNNVTELWQDTGGSLFPYTRNSSINFDYGTVNPASIAVSANIVCWLGINEKSGPFIMYSTGGDFDIISTDGINHQISQLTNPTNCHAFFLQLFGHLIYQITFPDDSLTLCYDFTTKQFFNLCDENMSYHPARRVAFFNDTYYFVSINDGNLYQLDQKYNTYDYGFNALDSPLVFEIPRVRICNTVRMPDTSPFIINSLNFVIEQGYQSVEDVTPRVDMSVSYDGGVSFGSYQGQLLNPSAIRANRFVQWNLGYGNEFTPQFRFWGFTHFLVGDGQINIYQ